MKIKSSTEKVDQLNVATVSEMFELFRQYYWDVCFDRFKKDLMEKTEVIFLKKDSKIIGFSTVLIFNTQDKNKILFSGDTVIDKDYWGTKALQLRFTFILWRERFKNPTIPLYWMLISKGFKTYLLMRRNFGSSFPNHRDKTPHHIQKIKDDFYSSKFGKCYNAENSLIDFGRSLGRVRDKIACPDKKALTVNEIQFFVEKNPDYQKGIELACVAQIRWVDLPYIAFKYFLKMARINPILHKIKYYSIKKQYINQ